MNIHSIETWGVATRVRCVYNVLIRMVKPLASRTPVGLNARLHYRQFRGFFFFFQYLFLSRFARSVVKRDSSPWRSETRFEMRRSGFDDFRLASASQEVNFAPFNPPRRFLCFSMWVELSNSETPLDDRLQSNMLMLTLIPTNPSGSRSARRTPRKQ